VSIDFNPDSTPILALGAMPATPVARGAVQPVTPDLGPAAIEPIKPSRARRPRHATGVVPG
jgi:hypothetical protein